MHWVGVRVMHSRVYPTGQTVVLVPPPTCVIADDASAVDSSEGVGALEHAASPMKLRTIAPSEARKREVVIVVYLSW